MASGHVNRTQRPNTWLHRPTLRREDSPCQLGAVTHFGGQLSLSGSNGHARLKRMDRIDANDPSRSSAAKFAVMHHTALIR
jgi:hypothetical protein